MTVLCLIQARAGSSRLPEKVLADIAGEPMLARVINRVRQANLVDDVAVATTDRSADDRVEMLGASLGVAVHRGSEFDVLDRYHQAVQSHPNADLIVRITADCPFIDPAVIDDIVKAQRETGADFVANRLPPPHRRTYPVGLDVEAATRPALEQAWADATAPHQREHVMPYLYENPSVFSTVILDLDEDLSAYRWTVDTPEDLSAARRLAELAGTGTLSWRLVLAVARQHPEVASLNSAVAAKRTDDVDARWTRASD